MQLTGETWPAVNACVRSTFSAVAMLCWLPFLTELKFRLLIALTSELTLVCRLSGIVTVAWSPNLRLHDKENDG